LVTTAGRALLPSPSRRATSVASVALTTVTTAAHKERNCLPPPWPYQARPVSVAASKQQGGWAQRSRCWTSRHSG
jgi:hypothetical protein